MEVRGYSWRCVGMLLCLLRVGSQGSSSLLQYRIQEELPRGTLIGNIVKDARLASRYTRAELSNLRFSFLEQPDENFKAIEIIEDSGVLRIARRIDRDAMCPQREDCEVFLDVAVGPAQYFQVINMKVSITDSNDNSPRFPQKQIALEISEATPAGMGFALPLAEDPDSGSFSVQMYELVSRSTHFDIRQTNRGLGEMDLKLVLRQQLDREAKDFYQIKVAAFDGGVPARRDEMTINITVLDANDNRPKFENQTYTVTVAENAPLNHTILKVHATDRDIGINGRVRYAFTDRTREHHGDLFGINARSGEIYLLRELDYEKESVYHLVVSATDGSPKLEPGTAAVVVNVRDVNDNKPQISVNTLTSSGRAEIMENSDLGAFVAHISARDQDSGKNGEVVCYTKDARFHLEHLQRTQYKIVTGMPLDREKEDRFRIKVICQDLGDPRQETTESVRVTVLDKNDNPPMFSKQYYSFRIRENNAPNTRLVTVNATDRDIGVNAAIVYSLHQDAGDQFQVHPSTGVVRATKALNFEEREEYRFHVIAEDRGSPRRSASAIVMITVLDVNDEPPRFTRPTYTFHVRENDQPHKTIGAVSANDRDAEPYNKVKYSLLPIGSTEFFAVNPENGRITTLQTLDRESKAIHHLTVEAANPGFVGMSSSVSVTIYVGDENDNPPVIDFPTEANNTVYLPNHLPLDYEVTRVRAHDSDDAITGNNAKMAFAITAGNEERYFKIDRSTGSVSVDSDLGSIESALFTFRILVEDQGSPQRRSWSVLNIVVNESLTIDFIGKPAGLTSMNRTIVIALTIASAIVMALLIIAIIIIKSCDRRDRKGKRTIKENSQNILSTKDSKDPDVHNLSNNSLDGSLKKEVTFNIKMEEPAPPPPPKRQFPPSPSSQSSGSSERNDTKYGPQSYERLAQHPASSPEIPPHSGERPRSRPPSMDDLRRPEGQTTLGGQRAAILRTVTSGPGEPEQYRQVVHMLKPDQQNDSCSESACSADISVTDSGKGPSEEGEHIDDVNVLPKDAKQPGTKQVESKILSPLPGRSPPLSVKVLPATAGQVQRGPPGTLPKAKHCYAGLPKHHTFMASDDPYGTVGPTTGGHVPVGYPISSATLASLNHQRAKLAQQLPFRSQSFNGTADPRAFKDARTAQQSQGPLKTPRVTFLDQRNNTLPQNGLAANGRGRPVKLCVTMMNEDDGIGSGSETDHTDHEDRSNLLSSSTRGTGVGKVAHDNRFHNRNVIQDKLNYSSDWTNDDDDTTTTSGSYVVDPEDMGIEIEAALASMDARSSNV